MKMIEVIQHGSGEKVQANQRHDYDTDGLPPDNLQPVMGGEGKPQWAKGTFLSGEGGSVQDNRGPDVVSVKQ